MADREILDKLDELTDAINLWNTGMSSVVASLELQSRMLADILKGVSVESDEESPLAQLLRQLVSASELHTDQLSAVTASLDRLHQRLPA
jgi:hypothetical protein